MFSEPSSSLTLERTFWAMKDATSLGISTCSSSAFFSIMAILVSTSGGCMSAVSPHSNLDFRRSLEVLHHARGLVARYDYLFFRRVEGVEHMKELFLGAVFSGDELDVVY